MLKQVRETGAALRLVARADIVINAHRDDRHRLVLVQDYTESVVECELFDRRVWNLKSFLHVESDPSQRWKMNYGSLPRSERDNKRTEAQASRLHDRRKQDARAPV